MSIDQSLISSLYLLYLLVSYVKLSHLLSEEQNNFKWISSDSFLFLQSLIISQSVIAKREQHSNINIIIYMTAAHIGVPGNEAADEAAKEATGWRPFGGASRASVPRILGLKILTSAVRNEIRTRARKIWADKWKIDSIEKTTHRLIKKSIKDVLTYMTDFLIVRAGYSWASLYIRWALFDNILIVLKTNV